MLLTLAQEEAREAAERYEESDYPHGEIMDLEALLMGARDMTGSPRPVRVLTNDLLLVLWKLRGSPDCKANAPTAFLPMEGWRAELFEQLTEIRNLASQASNELDFGGCEASQRAWDLLDQITDNIDESEKPRA